jgi:transcriptional regulator with XRE-family HTH domain
MNIGEKIKKLRTDKNIGVRELADDLGVSHAHISKLESGKSGASVEFLEKIAKYFHLHISYFFLDDEDQDPFTKSEQDLLFEKDLSLENIKQNYNLHIDGEPATDEEIEKMLEYIRFIRHTSKK